jgi:hypothetical protein
MCRSMTSGSTVAGNRVAASFESMASQLSMRKAGAAATAGAAAGAAAVAAAAAPPPPAGSSSMSASRS